MNAMQLVSMIVNYEFFTGLFGEVIELIITTMTAFTTLKFRERLED